MRWFEPNWARGPGWMSDRAFPLRLQNHWNSPKKCTGIFGCSSSLRLVLAKNCMPRFCVYICSQVAAMSISRKKGTTILKLGNVCLTEYHWLDWIMAYLSSNFSRTPSKPPYKQARRRQGTEEWRASSVTEEGDYLSWIWPLAKDNAQWLLFMTWRFKRVKNILWKIRKYPAHVLSLLSLHEIQFLVLTLSLSPLLSSYFPFSFYFPYLCNCHLISIYVDVFSFYISAK
jgi:hypothetical protein